MRRARLALRGATALGLFCVALGTDLGRSLHVAWEYETQGDLEGWGSATSEASGAEAIVLGGELRLEAQSSDPVVDSPLFHINATDRTVLVFRAAAFGTPGDSEVLWRLRRPGGAAPPPSFGAGLGDWRLEGNSEWDVRSTSFRVEGDGAARTYYVPLVNPASPGPTAAPQGALVQVRLRLWAAPSAGAGGAAHIDFIRISERPLVAHVSGCGRVTRQESLHLSGPSPDAPAFHPVSNPPPPTKQWARETGTTTDQRFHSWADAHALRDVGSDAFGLAFGSTYNCLRSGGDLLVISGSGFGPSDARVTVGGAACTEVRHDPAAPESRIACRSPAMQSGPEHAVVAVAQGRFPGLVDAKPLLSYAVGPRAPVALDASNVGATHLSASWSPRSLWDALATTGYVLEARSLLRPAELWAAFYPALLALGPRRSGAAGNDSVVSAPAGPDDVAAALPTGAAGAGPLLPQLASVLLERQESHFRSEPGDVGSGGAPDGELLPTPSVAELREASRISGVPAAVLAAVAVDRWGQVGWRSMPAPAGRNGSLLSQLGGWPALEAEPAAWSAWSRLASTGNVTSTTVAGLPAGTAVQLRVAALAEDTVLDAAAWQRVNAHGHREALPQGSQGPWSEAAAARTTAADILFDWFDANGTLSYGGADRRSTTGELGRVGGEGSWGLVLVGSAHVAGCNATHSCCDGFAAPSASQPSDGNAREFDIGDADGDGVVDQQSAWHAGWWRGALLPEAEAALSRPGDVKKVYPRHSGSVDPHAYTRAMQAVRDAGGEVPPGLPVPPLTNRSATPWSACRLACAAAARLRPPYVNAEALRASSQLPLPTPLPAAGVFPGSAGGPPPAPVGSAAAGGSDLSGALPGVPGRLPSGVTVVPPRYLARPPTGPCGPALRLTPSRPGQAGSAWYGRRMQVREGFSTEFVFQLSNPSYHCKRMDDASTNCRSRGADGLAFVIQDRHPAALGRAGGGQGWAGLPRAVAVSFDTWHNPEHSDPYENHVAVHAPPPPDSPVPAGQAAAEDGPPRDRPSSEGHAFALGAATEGVPDMADRPVHVRVVYEPLASGGEGSASGMGGGPAADAAGGGAQQLAWLAGNEYPSGGRGWWTGAEAGTLRVEMPPGREVLRVRVDLHAALGTPADGRAWVGFTAATGDLAFQSHEVLAWSLHQSYALAAAGGGAGLPGAAGRFPEVRTGA
ncbi:hypothetical protein FNF28_03884 [Cafeteria roenbergensis]|uniref:Uncharacterized protein n=1 Tax=Cafeteria roenbergensis TaxID=33653 RepID=A0A5A8DIA6_CAFRO|nr:hypothetical protein FNF28_03884 [Cafeteria roenbergensis]